MKILYYKDISLPEVLEILEKRMSENELKEGQKKMYEYVKKFSKIPADKAKEIIDKLMNQLNLTRDICVQIVNIMPTNIEELRSILPSDKYFSREDLEKILSIIHK
jgi:DNA-directed RNA polymerase subunit F